MTIYFYEINIILGRDDDFFMIKTPIINSINFIEKEVASTMTEMQKVIQRQFSLKLAFNTSSDFIFVWNIFVRVLLI